MALNYRPPQLQQEQDQSGLVNSMDRLFNAYNQAKQNAMQFGGQQMLQGLQIQGAQANLQNANREQTLAGLQDTAQFGAPLASYSPQQIQQAGQPIPPSIQDDGLGYLRAGLEQIKTARAQKQKLSGLEVGLKESEIEENKANAWAKMNPQGATGVKAEDELRGELQTLSKPFYQVRDSMGRIEASAKNPSAAGDLALIFNYMKVLDPGSTVREGEFATAQNSAGVPSRIVAQYNKVINGERLADNQRQDFLERARELYNSQESIQKQQEGQYRSLAQRRGAKPENVILNQSLPAQVGLPQSGIASPEQIRAQFKAGKITREQARAQIKALGGVRGR